MEYKITAEEGLIRARVSGRTTDEPPSQVCQAVLAEANRLGIKRILVELTQKVALSGSSQFHLVVNLTSLGMTPQHRIALVHHTRGLYEASDMVDLAASNRGMNIKTFRNVEAALAWLA
jgi:shikimate 5-dehydrogenase